MKKTMEGERIGFCFLRPSMNSMLFRVVLNGCVLYCMLSVVPAGHSAVISRLSTVLYVRSCTVLYVDDVTYGNNIRPAYESYLLLAKAPPVACRVVAS